MLKRTGILFVTALIPLFLCGCPMNAADPGGLKASDFEIISHNGFDSYDQLRDKNDYAWAMEYFEPDDGAPPYLYVGTGNDMLGLMAQGMSAMMGGGSLGDVSVCPPEIRRYRPDQGLMTWERVFDYRDVEPEGHFQTIGFRHMRAYRAQSDGVNCLYAATFGQEATVWRTATGAPGSWEKAWTSGEIGSVRMMTEHDGILYLALSNDAPEGERVGKIWATDGATFWPVIEDAFGNPNNTGVMSLVSFNGWLYAGTQNDAEGYEVWKLEGPGEKQAPVLVVSNGGPSAANQSAITPCVFQGSLYLGNMTNHMANILNGFKAADIIRIDADDTWTTVVGPGGVSGYGSGFGHWPNTYIWSMEVHDGWLYAGTYDQASVLPNLIDNLDRFLAALFGSLKRNQSAYDALTRAGADFYKTRDGVTWYPVTITGFDDPGNYGIRVLESVGGTLYAGTSNASDGLEIWRGQNVTQ